MDLDVIAILVVMAAWVLRAVLQAIAKKAPKENSEENPYAVPRQGSPQPAPAEVRQEPREAPKPVAGLEDLLREIGLDLEPREPPQAPPPRPASPQPAPSRPRPAPVQPRPGPSAAPPPPRPAPPAASLPGRGAATVEQSVSIYEGAEPLIPESIEADAGEERPRPRGPRRLARRPGAARLRRGLGSGVLQDLGNRHAVARAMVLREILGPPVGLRDP